MNILRELRAGLKAFILWAVVMFLLVYIGIIKYEGATVGDVNMSELLAQFPRIVLAVLGVVGVDINSLGGYTSILTFYVLICAVIYAVHLGSSTVSRESADKTYEFVFTKPCSRSRVLTMKLLAAWLYLALFSILYAVLSAKAAASIKSAEDITKTIILFALSLFLIGSLFIGLSAFLAAAAKRADKGALYGNLAFLYAFILGVVYDMLENGGIIRLISPFRYFIAPDVLNGRLDPVYVALTVVLTAASLYGAFVLFKKKDLN